MRRIQPVLPRARRRYRSSAGLARVRRQSGWMSYCLIQQCSRRGQALPHQDAPDAASLCQSAPDVDSVTLGRCRSSIRGRASRRGHHEPGAVPACRGGSSARPAFLFDRRTCFPVPTWRSRSHGAQRRGREERSHPEPRAARPYARAWRGWRASDLPRSEHRGILRTSRRIRPSPLH